MAISTLEMDEVYVLPDRFIQFLKGNCLLSLYIILLNFIKIGQELFKTTDIQNHSLTDRQTDTHRHADENYTCPKTKFLGQVKMCFYYLIRSQKNCNFTIPGLDNRVNFDNVTLFDNFKYFVFVFFKNNWRSLLWLIPTVSLILEPSCFPIKKRTH